MNSTTAERLKSMYLSGIAKSLDMRIEQAIREKFSYTEFFELLLADEVGNRTNNGNIRRMQRAHFSLPEKHRRIRFQRPAQYQPTEHLSAGHLRIHPKEREHHLHRQAWHGEKPIWPSLSASKPCCKATASSSQR